MRVPMPREFYIPKGATKIADKLSDAVAYIYPILRADGVRKFGGLGFHGKAQKPDWHFTFSTEERRADHIAKAFENCRLHDKAQTDRRAARKAEGRGMDVGDVLRASWGYDQTNIDYWEVTALVGTKMVEVRPIAQRVIEDGFMSGKCAPRPGEYTGPATRHVARSGAVKFESFRHAYRVEPTIVAGVKLYETSRWSSYA
jgi:hypothetical protein